MNSFIQDDELLEKYNGVWNKVSNSIKEDCESVFNKKILKTKIRSYGDEDTDCHSSKISDAGSDCICCSRISIDSVFKKDENYNLEVFLK